MAQCRRDRFDYSLGGYFTVGMSIGVVISEKKDRRSLDDCVREADALMYDIKTARKVGR